MCGYPQAGRIIWWLDVTAAKESWHQVERRGRKQQNMIRVTKRKRCPNKRPLIVDKSPSLVQELKQSFKEGEGSFKAPI